MRVSLLSIFDAKFNRCPWEALNFGTRIIGSTIHPPLMLSLPKDGRNQLKAHRYISTDGPLRFERYQCHQIITHTFLHSLFWFHPPIQYNQLDNRCHQIIILASQTLLLAGAEEDPKHWFPFLEIYIYTTRSVSSWHFSSIISIVVTILLSRSPVLRLSHGWQGYH